VGGLAGISINSNLIDINVLNKATNQPGSLTGDEALIWGRQVVGGLVGAAVTFNTEGDNNNYRIENVFSDVSVLSTLASETQNRGRVQFQGADHYLQNNRFVQFDETVGGGRATSYGISVAGGLIGLATNMPLGHAEYLMRDINGKPIDLENTTIQPTNVNNPAIKNAGNYIPRVGTRYNVKAIADIAGGLFGFVDRNIIVDGAVNELFGTAAVYGNYWVGGLVGANMGHITNSRVSDVGEAEAILNFRTVTSYIISHSGAHYGLIGGGLAGFNGGTVSNSRAFVNIDGLANNAVNMLCIGGLIGENKSGVVTGNTVSGVIIGGYNVGGLIGVNNMMAGSIISGNTILVDVNTAGTVSAFFNTGGLGSVMLRNPGWTQLVHYSGNIIGYNADVTLNRATVIANNINTPNQNHFGTMKKTAIAW
jgi:hypothetical protein